MFNQKIYNEINTYPNINSQGKENINQINRGKLLHATKMSAGVALAVLLAVAVTSPPSQAAPTGGVVANGTANIATNGTNTTIAQTTKRAVINWAGFDVAADENVEFKLPNNGATLNNISGATSQILGQVTSNGTLYFVNQNGFVFGPQSSITAKNLLITTQTIQAENFRNINNRDVEKYNAPSNLDATISLNGAITVAYRGVIAVFAPHINTADTAKLRAGMGSIILAGGKINSTEFTGNGLISYELTGTGLPTSVENNGSLDTSMVDKDGGVITLMAANGTAILTRKGTVNVGENGTFTYNSNINNSDIVIDESFLKQIHYQPSMSLTFSAGQDLVVLTTLPGDDKSRLNFTAGRGITFNSKISTGGLTTKSLYLYDYNDLSIGKGGLNITTTGRAPQSYIGIMINGLIKGKADTITIKDDGDINLTAYNGGQIYVRNAMTANNINITSYGGGIGLYGNLDANNKTGVHSNINLTLHQKGNIWVNSPITANNITALAENGAINFQGNVTTRFPSLYLNDNGNLIVTAQARRGKISFSGNILSSIIKVHSRGDQFYNGWVLSDTNILNRGVNVLDISTNGYIYNNDYRYWGVSIGQKIWSVRVP